MLKADIESLDKAKKQDKSSTAKDKEKIEPKKIDKDETLVKNSDEDSLEKPKEK